MHTFGEESVASILLVESVRPSLIWIGPWSVLLGRRILLPAYENGGIIRAFALEILVAVCVGGDTC